jgi:dTDP-4-amino-4,6-dideoxygalactose transaminase
MNIPYNKPYFNQKCLDYIKDTFHKGTQSGDGFYSKEIYKLLKDKYNFNNVLLTPSCTHSLEMMAMLLDVKKNDEIIIPSYTFVSTANAFVKFGARVIFVDSMLDNPNIDPNKIEEKITKNTKAICIVHYAGWACDMDKIIYICKKYNIILLEDAAQAIHSFYKNKPIGSFGAISAFSFHETKNINCGEGGMLIINDEKYLDRAEIIREKGTNRTKFSKGEINKYQWIDKGSSYLLSDINAAYLYPQFEDIDNIIFKRKIIWEKYYEELNKIVNKNFITAEKLNDCDGNYHIFYLLFKNNEELQKLKKYLNSNKILSVTHYVPLHRSEYYLKIEKLEELKNADYFGNCLLRLPIFNSLSETDLDFIINKIKDYYI